PEPAGRTLSKQEGVVGGLTARRRSVERLAAKQVVGEELERQRTVDVDRPLELGKPVDDVLGALEVAVALKALGRDHLREQAHDALALRRDLHLVNRGEEQVA